jgi:MATE family multidrug resistance protein
MLANLVGYWAVGLPLGGLLCFRWKLGAVGMWSGLCLALIMIGSVLLMVWRRQIRELVAVSTQRSAVIIQSR